MSASCLICCDENVSHFGVWDCGHDACWRCALRLHASSAALECIMCKQASSKIYVTQTTRGSRKKETHAAAGWDAKTVACATPQIAKMVSELKTGTCPPCGERFTEAEGYMRHLTAKHNKALCRICVTARPQVFLAEHVAYELPDGLRVHESMDEDHPKDEWSFMGHPQCRLCGERVYDNMALLDHVGAKHLSCTFCDAATAETHTTVYKDAKSLAAHLKASHAYCVECHELHVVKGANAKLVNPMQFAFKSELDLAIHRAKVHEKRGKKSHGLGHALPDASAASSAPPPQPAAQWDRDRPGGNAYAIVFAHGNKLERVPLIDTKDREPPPPAPLTPPEASMPAPASGSPSHRASGAKGGGRGGGRGRGRGRGYAAPEPAADAAPAIKQKFAVEFVAENGMAFGFNPVAGGHGMTCTVGGTALPEVVMKIICENGGVSLKFPELRKRLKLPVDHAVRAVVLSELGALATRCGVEHSIPDVTASGQVDEPPPSPPAAKPPLPSLPSQPGRGRGASRPAVAAPAPAPMPKPALTKPQPPKASKSVEFAPLTDEIKEELETLAAIFGEEAVEALAPSSGAGVWGPLPEDAEASTKYRYRVEGEANGKPTAIFLEFFYPAGYPEVPPVVEFATDTTCGAATSYAVLPRHMAAGVAQDVLDEYEGEPVVYACVEWANENFEERLKILMSGAGQTQSPLAVGGGGSEEFEQAAAAPVEVDLGGLEVTEGPAISDRKSKFVAHAAQITSHADAMRVVRYLRSIKRIAVAAHPTIWAYRLADGGRVREERDDDGETGAADKLLFFLQRANVTGYVVVVTRWYGGIHLGSDRFKHILTVAKELLQQLKVVKEAGKK